MLNFDKGRLLFVDMAFWKANEPKGAVISRNMIFIMGLSKTRNCLVCARELETIMLPQC
jgi:hypothetical protein